MHRVYLVLGALVLGADGAKLGRTGGGGGEYVSAGDGRGGMISAAELREHLFDELASALLDDFGTRGALSFFDGEEGRERSEVEEDIVEEKEAGEATAAAVGSVLLRGSAAAVAAQAQHTVATAKCCCNDMRMHCADSALSASASRNRFFEVSKCLAEWERANGDLEVGCSEVIHTQTLAGACLEDIEEGGVCGAVTPGDHRLHRCLHENRKGLSRRCGKYMERAFPSYMMLPREEENQGSTEPGDEEGMGEKKGDDIEDERYESVPLPALARPSHHRPRLVWIAIASIVGVGVIIAATLAVLGRKTSIDMDMAESIVAARKSDTLYTSLLVASPVRLKR